MQKRKKNVKFSASQPFREIFTFFSRFSRRNVKLNNLKIN